MPEGRAWRREWEQVKIYLITIKACRMMKISLLLRLLLILFILTLLPPRVPCNSRRWPFHTFCRYSIHVCTCGEAWVIESSGYVAYTAQSKDLIESFLHQLLYCIRKCLHACGKWSKARKLIKYWFINFLANLSCFTDLLHYCYGKCSAWFC